MSTSPGPGLGTGISCTDNVPPSPTRTPCIFSGAADAARLRVDINAGIHDRMGTPENMRGERDHFTDTRIRKARESVIRAGPVSRAVNC
jgi:hypothetical protein